MSNPTATAASTTSMDVDPSSGDNSKTGGLSSSPKIWVHPLAIVNMSDQFTRITLGGSPLPSTEPVVGLLFGTFGDETSSSSASSSSLGLGMKPAGSSKSTSAKSMLQIHDAGDVPLPTTTEPTTATSTSSFTLSEAAQTHISLHQAVFSNHFVVGWYRVETGASGPTPADLMLTQQLQHYFQKHQQQGSDGSSSMPFVFTLLQLAPSSSSSPTDQKKKSSESAMIMDTNQTANENHDDDELPFTLYQLDPLTQQVLLALEHNHDWKLETPTAERVAVERVLKEKPSKPTTTTVATATTTTTTTAAPAPPAPGGGGAAAAASSFLSQLGLGGGGNTYTSNDPESAGTPGDASSAISMPDPESIALIRKTNEMKHALRAIQERIAILQRFLRQQQQQSSSSNNTMDHERLALLRQVQGLILQLGPLAAATVTTTAPSTSPQALLQALAVTSQTVDAVQAYAEKIRFVNEVANSSRGGGGGGNGMGGGTMSSLSSAARRRGSGASGSNLLRQRY